MATKTEILLILLIFYGLVGVFISAVGVSMVSAELEYDTDSVDDPLGVFTYKGIVTGFSAMGETFNAVFFGSFVIIIGWILISSFLGNGGS